jgi:5-methylcytosine-specific restriction enzyme subunit McrC
MIRLSVREHTRVFRSGGGTSTSPPTRSDATQAHTLPSLEAAPRPELPPPLYDRLRRYDQEGRDEAQRLFDWRDGYFRSTQWVGVVQPPGLQLEVLPKVEEDPLTGQATESSTTSHSRLNLLYMLSVGGLAPFRPRDLAALRSSSAPLSELLTLLFAKELRRQLLRGPARDYILKREQLRSFRGKLRISEQLLHNSARRERFACEFDEFVEDTALGRVLAATCLKLHAQVASPSAQEALRHCLLLLEGVSSVPLTRQALDQVQLDRRNERFATSLEFCRLFFFQRAPSLEAGRSPSFSLFFDMNVVYERFVAGFVTREVLPQHADLELHRQSTRRRRHLIRDPALASCQNRILLRPDILLSTADQAPILIDTKWKRLAASRRLSGVSEADIYQLHAYAHRFGASRVILLYPSAAPEPMREVQFLTEHGIPHACPLVIATTPLHGQLSSTNGRASCVSAIEKALGLVTAHQ